MDGAQWEDILKVSSSWLKSALKGNIGEHDFLSCLTFSCVFYFLWCLSHFACDKYLTRCILRVGGFIPVTPPEDTACDVTAGLLAGKESFLVRLPLQPGSEASNNPPPHGSLIFL